MTIYGDYFSNEQIYRFERQAGIVKHYKAKYPANATKIGIQELKPILESANDLPPAGQPKAVLVSGKKQMDAIIDAGFGGWSGMAKLHYYDSSVSAGQKPQWVMGFDSYANLIIHEYAPGKIAWMRPENIFDNDILIYFEPCDPPSEPNPETPGDEVIVAGVPKKYKISLLGGLVTGTVEAIE